MSTIAPTTTGTLGGLVAAAGSETERRQQVALAAREFEAMFLLQMLRQMRQSMLADDAETQGLGAATMADTVDTELARHLAGQAGGLFDVIQRAFTANGPQPHAVPAGAVPPAVPAGAGNVPPTLSLPAGRITSSFGWRTDPLNGGTRLHKGIDVAAVYGTGVPAAGDGRVVFAGTQGGYGQTVVLEHAGGVRTRYAHLSQVDVAEGADVAAGALVGRVGSSGRSTGPHLHFEVLQNGRAVDPAKVAHLYGLKEILPVPITRPGQPVEQADPAGVDDEN